MDHLQFCTRDVDRRFCGGVVGISQSDSWALIRLGSGRHAGSRVRFLGGGQTCNN